MEAVKNKKAFYDYFFEDNYECGIVLEGWEVKPILNRQINLDASHVIYQDGALFLLNAIVNPHQNTYKHNPSIPDNIMLNYADLNLNQSGQYGQIYAEKFTSASLICKVFYGKMKAQWGKYTLLLNLL